MEFADLILTPKVDGVTVHSVLQPPMEGTLCITGHHLILSARQDGVQELWLLHRNIDYVERKPIMMNNKEPQGGQLVLKCKDLRIIVLEISSPEEFLNVAKSLEQLSHIDDTRLHYPFFYRPMYSILEDGYTMYSTELEFAKLLASEEWRITTVNKDYALCPTYSATLVVPKSITDEQIRQSAEFRDGGRFPVISYRHTNGVVLLRSAQPASNSSSKRSRADEAILNCVLGRCKKGFIIDTWGKGKSNTETDQHYTQWKKVARPLANVAMPLAILESFTKLIEACNDTTCTMDKWLSRLNNSNWHTLVVNVMDAACVVSQCIDKEGSPVMVHGGQGLDSTLIVTSLVQIILNKDCRTVRGFQALIEREWINGGHPFGTRHRQSCYTPAQMRWKTSGATFALFLDCVYQLNFQFARSFEFCTHFLITLFEHSYFSQYGTFLCDSEKERVALKVHKRTTSLWSYMNRPDVMKSLLNPMYEPNPLVIWPSVAPVSIELWLENYQRWVVDQSHSKRVLESIQSLLTEEKELQSEAHRLKKELSDLCQEFDDKLKTSVEVSCGTSELAKKEPAVL